MESQEYELFSQQSNDASHLNQRLGFGIGLFQVMTKERTGYGILLHMLVLYLFSWTKISICIEFERLLPCHLSRPLCTLLNS